MTDHDGPKVEGVHLDYLLEPIDLKSIMARLRGKEFSIEELAYTLLAGGIELEYFSTKYKTNRGYKNLLIVIACQDSLEVDWDDLDARCKEVIEVIVAVNGKPLEGGAGEPEPPEVATPELEKAPEPEKGPEQSFLDKLAWVQRVIAKSRDADILSGGIAPVWSEPHRGPAYRSDPGPSPGPELGLRPGSPGCDPPLHLQKNVEELIRPPLGSGSFPLEPGGYLDISKFLLIVQDDISKWKYVSEWSKVTLESIICETELTLKCDRKVATRGSIIPD
jgi:hypothetical protein